MTPPQNAAWFSFLIENLWCCFFISRCRKMHRLIIEHVCPVVEPFSYSHIPAGCGQFLTFRTWLDWQNSSLDDRLWKDYRLATGTHLGPPHALGRGQSRRWLPVGSGQPHWYTGQYAATDLNTTLEIYTFFHQSWVNDYRCTWLLKWLCLNCWNYYFFLSVRTWAKRS